MTQKVLDILKNDGWDLKIEEHLRGLYWSFYSTDHGDINAIFILKKIEQGRFTIICFPQVEPSSEHHTALLRLLNAINMEVLYGGFALKLEKDEIRYTNNIDFKGSELSDYMILNVVNAAFIITRRYLPVLKAFINNPDQSIEALLELKAEDMKVG